MAHEQNYEPSEQETKSEKTTVMPVLGMDPLDGPADTPLSPQAIVAITGLAIGLLLVVVFLFTPLPLLVEIGLLVLLALGTAFAYWRTTRPARPQPIQEPPIPPAQQTTAVVQATAQPNTQPEVRVATNQRRPSPPGVEWRYPPATGRPELKPEGPWYSGFSARLYGAVFVVFLVLYILLASIFSLPWWSEMAPPLLGCVAAMIYYPPAVKRIRRIRRDLLETIIDEIDGIMWPAQDKQGISDAMMWKIICVIQSGTKEIKVAKRSRIYQLLFHKAREPLEILATLFGVVIGLVVLQVQSWMPEVILDIYPWIYLAVLVLILITGLVLAHQTIEWFNWIYIRTDQNLYTVRLCPIWFPWMQNENESVHLSRIVTVVARDQVGPPKIVNIKMFWGKPVQVKIARFNWGQRLGYGIISANPASTSGDGEKMDIINLRYMGEWQQETKEIQDDIQINNNAPGKDQSRTADATEQLLAEARRGTAATNNLAAAIDRLLSQTVQPGQAVQPQSPKIVDADATQEIRTVT